MRKLPTCDLLSHGSEGCLNSVDSPLQMKLIKYLGLKKYMIDNFIFKRKPSSTSIYLLRVPHSQKIRQEYLLPLDLVLSPSRLHL